MEYNLPVKRRIKIILCFTLFLFLLFWQWNGWTTTVDMSGDMSVRGVAQYLLRSKDLNFGKDFFSPESTYSWLYSGNMLMMTERYRVALFRFVVILVLPAVLRTFDIVLFWNRAQTYSAKVIAIVASIGIFLSYTVGRISVPPNGSPGLYIFDMCVVQIYILTYLVYTMLAQGKKHSNRDKTKLIFAILSISFLISLAPQIKFSAFPTTLAILIMLTAILFYYKKYRELAIFFISCTLFPCLLWILAGEKLEYMLPYVKSQLVWANKGYSEIMSLPLYAGAGTIEDFLFAIFICFIYVISIAYFWKKDRIKAVSWFIIAPLIYINIRYAFTRSEITHTRTFMASTVYIIAFYLLLILQDVENQKPSTYYNEKFCKLNQKIWPAILVFLLFPSIAGYGWYPMTTIATDYKALGNFNKYAAAKETNINQLRAEPVLATLYEEISKYPDKTVGMLCTDQMLFFAYDLENKFNPFPFGYMAMNSSSETELMLANYYYSENAPDLVIHNYEPWPPLEYINMNMTLHMGTIFQALVENYHVDIIDKNQRMILLKNDIQKHESVKIGETQTVSVGDTIIVPKVDDAFVFLKVEWNLTPLGSIAAKLLKPTKSFVEFTTDSGEIYKPNFFRTVSENGIYVSSIATSTQEWVEIINGNTKNRSVESLRFEGDRLCYEQKLRISFYAVPYTQAQKDYNSIKG